MQSLKVFSGSRDKITSVGYYWTSLAFSWYYLHNTDFLLFQVIPLTTENSKLEQWPPEKVLFLKHDTGHFHRLSTHIYSLKDLFGVTEKRNCPLYWLYYSEHKKQSNPAPFVGTKRLNCLSTVLKYACSKHRFFLWELKISDTRKLLTKP